MKLSKNLAALAAFAVLLVLLVGGLSAVQSRMNAIRIDEKLTDTEPLENAPPMVVLTTVALGGFRGLVADWLWLRSNRMQEQGNYFEMVQLASWITKLQPRFTGATAFLAWNMAYNVSVTFTSPEDRWRWVRRGIELIRDEALEYNPSDPELFQQLGWIYQHKMGKDLDDANRYYKTQFALEMIMVFGDYAGKWDLIGRAAPTEAKLKAQLGGDDAFWTVLASRGLTFAALEKEFRKNGLLPDDLVAELDRRGIREPVELCLRRRWLLEKYRLIPELILRLNDTYGPLDWRLPEAHAIYWATRGKEQWDEHEDNFKRLQCDRMIFQSLNAAFQGGRLVYIRDVQMLTMTPNIDLADATRKAYDDAMGLYGESTVRGAFQNFMVDAIVNLYKFGRKQKAAEFFRDARQRFGNRFSGGLDEFVLHELGEDMKTPNYNQAQGTVEAYIEQMCLNLAIGEAEQAAYYELIARKLHAKYQEFAGESTKARRWLPPFDQMKRSYISGPLRSRMPEPLYNLLMAQLPDELKAREAFDLQRRAGVVEAPPGAPGAPAEAPAAPAEAPAAPAGEAPPAAQPAPAPQP
ncbi:MAG: hypothetical protein GX595_07055 [Lentisphaerae bacterium]|nr:hypothetical protein [Lentisphaerota bacterium]